MGFPSVDEVVRAVSEIEQDSGTDIKTNGLWHALMFARYKCLSESSANLHSISSYDLVVAAFDLTGIALPGTDNRLTRKTEQVFYEPAAQGSTSNFRKGEGARNTYLNKFQEIIGRQGKHRQPEIFIQGPKHVPVQVRFESDWIGKLRAFEANRHVLDDKIHELITWLFRFGVPRDDSKTTSLTSSTETQDELLIPNRHLLSKPIPKSPNDLGNELMLFFGLEIHQINELFPKLNEACKKDRWSEETRLSDQELRGRLVAQVYPTSGDAVPTARVDDLIAHLQACPCVVLQGPPGTGKTYRAEQLIDHFAEKTSAQRQELQFTHLLAKYDGNLEKLLASEELKQLPVVWELVQMHPGYAYDDFVRGQVIGDSEGLSFVSLDRIAVEMARVAQARNGKTTILIMDEINRCNLASVLGELILILEKSKRSKQHQVRLQYSAPPGQSRDADLLWLPDNLWMIGTMNTADRSIALVDYAIRRRFRFIDVLPERTALQNYYEGKPKLAEQATRLYDLVNPTDPDTRLIENSNLQIGHSYFMVPPQKDWESELVTKFLYEVVPLLREYYSERRLRDQVGNIKIGEAVVIPLDGPGDVSFYVADVVTWLKKK